jgi:hypothetical protein
MTHTFPNSAIICLYRLGILAGVTLGDLDADGWVGPAAGIDAFAGESRDAT